MKNSIADLKKIKAIMRMKKNMKKKMQITFKCGNVRRKSVNFLKLFSLLSSVLFHGSVEWIKTYTIVRLVWKCSELSRDLNLRLF